MKDYDSAEFLENDEMIAEYLHKAAERGDKKHFMACLSRAIRARAINRLAAEAGVGREEIYEMLSKNGKPNLEAITKVTGLYGLPSDALLANAL
jgi:probable addiction module antidote protein